MREFRRRLNLFPLQRLASADGDNWWKDLLRLWEPSGTGAGSSGLRLAIRNNYLNFYRRGQSVARVAFDRNGLPYPSVHCKYLGGEADAYAALKDGFFIDRSGAVPQAFEPRESFHRIIAQTRSKAGKEKYFVDQVVAQNASVIDLEIGFPRLPGSKEGAPRIDLALLERGANDKQVKLVFWEAKTIDDDRLRATLPEEAEVHRQLRKYVDYMKDSGRRAQVVAEYREYCRLLVQLAAMVPSDKSIALSPLIGVAATSEAELSVDKEPRLVILEGDTESAGTPCRVTRVSTWDKYYPSMGAWRPRLFTDGDGYRLTD